MRPKSKKYTNSKGKPSTKGATSPKLKLGDKFRTKNGKEFEISAIDPEDNLPYTVLWTSVPWVAYSAVSCSFILRECKRV